MLHALPLVHFHKKTRVWPGPNDGDDRSKDADGDLGKPLDAELFGLGFRFSGRLSFQQLEQCLHLGHDTPHFS